MVGYPHDIKGTGIYAFVLTKGDAGSDDGLVDALVQQVRKVIGPIATPDRILVVPGLPKTRSGKIMRRILRQIAAGNDEDLGDVTTLAEPGVVADIVAAHRGGS